MGRKLTCVVRSPKLSCKQAMMVSSEISGFSSIGDTMLLSFLSYKSWLRAMIVQNPVPSYYKDTGEVCRGEAAEPSIERGISKRPLKCNEQQRCTQSMSRIFRYGS